MARVEKQRKAAVSRAVSGPEQQRVVQGRATDEEKQQSLLISSAKRLVRLGQIEEAAAHSLLKVRVFFVFEIGLSACQRLDDHMDL